MPTSTRDKKTGKFTGSIGEGKHNVPTPTVPLPTVTVHNNLRVLDTSDDGFEMLKRWLTSAIDAQNHPEEWVGREDDRNAKIRRLSELQDRFDAASVVRSFRYGVEPSDEELEELAHGKVPYSGVLDLIKVWKAGHPNATTRPSIGIILRFYNSVSKAPGNTERDIRVKGLRAVYRGAPYNTSHKEVR